MANSTGFHGAASLVIKRTGACDSFCPGYRLVKYVKTDPQDVVRQL